MPRPPGLEIDALIDASVQAHANSVVERKFSASQLPRLSEAGIVEPADIHMSVQFSTYENRVAMAGELSGEITMTCQRCMQPVTLDIGDQFRLLIVEDEADPEAEAGGFEPVIADPARLDMRWLAEEQTLLCVPLVPKHAEGECAAEAVEDSPDDATVAQRPFANLRDLLRDQ